MFACCCEQQTDRSWRGAGIMSAIYDNWERLVAATLKREKWRELALASSRETSFSSSLPDDLSHTYSSNSAQGDIPPADTGATRAIAGSVAARAARLFARFRRRKGPDHHRFPADDEVPKVHHLGHLKRFSLRELQVATDNFNTRNIVGRDAFGKVYKGQLTDGSLVAVKRLVQGTPDVEPSFQTEVLMIGLAVHRNLLRLRGVCMTPEEKMLVYPFMANGNLASCLRERPESQPPLNWVIRKQIAIGVARGLAYLHDHCNPKIIHRDVKAANILLDEGFEAVVCGFGWALLMDNKETHVTAAVCGTVGYIAPEYSSSYRCSVKTDVYAYGVMLLELISGQRASDLASIAYDDRVILLHWVKGVMKNKKLERLVDKDLAGNYIDSEVKQLIQVALLCTESSPIRRPEMSQVIRMLESKGLAGVESKP